LQEIEASMAELTGLRNQAQKAVEKSQALISEMKTTSEILGSLW
jgi:uncharacterized protein YoaH (UPF0181 family)